MKDKKIAIIVVVALSLTGLVNITLSTGQVALTSGIDNSYEDGVDEENVDEITSSYNGFTKQAFLVSTENEDDIMEVGEDIVWKLSIIVENTFDGEMEDVVVTDIIPPHLSVWEEELPDGSYSNVGDFEVVKKGNGNGATHVTWNISTLASKNVAVLELIIDTSGKVGNPYYNGPRRYHLNSGAKLKFTDPEGIKYNVQTEKIEFDIPGEMPLMPPLLYLFEKNPVTWRIVPDCAWGRLEYNHEGSEFEYDFYGYGLLPDTYDLIYYADPWPGDNPGALIDSGSTADSEIHIFGSVDLEMDLPDSEDANENGAKIWLVLSEDYVYDEVTHTGSLKKWNPTKYLFENNLIVYDYTEPPL
jgi:hypothetical protein